MSGVGRETKLAFRTPSLETVSTICEIADGLKDSEAGLCALELVALAEELEASLTPTQRLLLFKAGGHLVRAFRTQHPELYENLLR